MPRISHIISYPFDTNDSIQEIVTSLEEGGVIAYPTETVYGLGADVYQPHAVESVYHLKGRPPDMPLPVLIPDTDSIQSLVQTVPEPARLLMETFWPGALTLIFHATDVVPDLVTAGTGNLGVRLSGDPFCLALMNVWKRPLISTSANPSGKPPALSAEMCRQYFSEKVNLIVDAGVRDNNMPSTVLDTTCNPYQMIREGAISKKDIEHIIGIL